jgi:hypothetical protein
VLVEKAGAATWMSEGRAVLTVPLPFAASNASQSPLEEIAVFTMATAPGLSAYVVLLPLITQLPPVRPSL